MNLPLLEFLEKMHKYAKFLRDAMSHRKKIGRGEKIAFNDECSAVVSRRVPTKLLHYPNRDRRSEFWESLV